MPYIFGTGAGAEPMAQLYSRAGAQNIGGQIQALNQAAALHMKMKELQAQRDSEDKALGFQRDNADAQRAFQSSESAANRAADQQKFGADLGLKREGMAQHHDEFGATEGRLGHEFDATNDRLSSDAAARQALDQQRLGLDTTIANNNQELGKGRLANETLTSGANAGLTQAETDATKKKTNHETVQSLLDDIATGALKQSLGGAAQPKAAPSIPPLMVDPGGDSTTSTTSTAAAESPSSGPAGPVGPLGGGSSTPFGGGDMLQKIIMQQLHIPTAEDTKYNQQMRELNLKKAQRDADGLPNTYQMQEQQSRMKIAARDKAAELQKQNPNMPIDEVKRRTLESINTALPMGMTALTDVPIEAPYVDAGTVDAHMRSIGLGSGNDVYKAQLDKAIRDDAEKKASGSVFERAKQFTFGAPTADSAGWRALNPLSWLGALSTAPGKDPATRYLMSDAIKDGMKREHPELTDRELNAWMAANR